MILKQKVNTVDTGLSDSTIESVCGVFANDPRVEKAVLYGSRAMGTFRNRPDIDLTLEGENLSLNELLKIESDIDDLLLPYKIDLAIYHKIENPDLIEHIRQNGVVFYEKS